MQSEWQTHQGKRVFYCNYTHLGIEDLQIEMDAVDALLIQEPTNSVLILTDVRGMIGTPQIVNMFKKSASVTKGHIRRSALIGIGFTGPKKVLFDIVIRFSGQDVTLFDDIEKAKDWLVSEKG